MAEKSTVAAGAAAIAAVMSVVYTVYIADDRDLARTRLTTLQYLLEQTKLCPAFEERVLGLRDRGFDKQQIIAIIDAEPMPDFRDPNANLEEILAKSGPAYEFFYRPQCGPILDRILEQPALAPPTPSPGAPQPTATPSP